MKAVLFDLDETLLDRSASLERFITWQSRAIFASSGSQSDDFYTRFVELDDSGKVWKDVVYARLVDEFSIRNFSAEQLLEQYEKRFCEFCRAAVGVDEMIDQLVEQGYKLGLVSNGPSPFQERNFRALGFADKFSSIVVSAAVGYSKPQQQIFQIACDQLQVSRDDCVFVGDNPVADIAGAKACGMYSVYVPGRLGHECVEAEAVCTHFDQLPAIIEQAKRDS